MSSDPVDVSLSVKNRWDSLTKPPGSLGELEQIVGRLAILRGNPMPSVHRKAVYVFAADHGVTAESVSPYPQSVTRQMLLNFVTGGAAINVIARAVGATTVVVDVGVCGDPVPGVETRKIGSGTRNFAQEAAMSREQAELAVQTGRQLALAAAERYDIVALGEMGIGNTTSAAALLSAFAGVHPTHSAGRGTGLDDAGVRQKAAVIQRALERHCPDAQDPIGVLAAVGGFEIGAIAGFILGAKSAGLPVVLDGFPCCAGALIAQALEPAALQSAFFSHLSSESAHSTMLGFLSARPCLHLGMRLGEGTGAALMLGLIDTAVRLYREMATFEEAGVSKGGPKNDGLA